MSVCACGWAAVGGVQECQGSQELVRVGGSKGSEVRGWRLMDVIFAAGGAGLETLRALFMKYDY